MAGVKRKASERNDGGGVRPAAWSGMAFATVAVVVLLVAVSAVLFFVPSPRTPATGGTPREPVELAMGVAGHERWLDAVRAWVKLACLRLRQAAGGEPGTVRAAATKSLKMGKEVVEHTAESAARATEEVIERTTETVKRKVSARSTSAGDL